MGVRGVRLQAWATTTIDFGASATASRQPRTADRMIATGHGISGFGGKLGRRGPTRTDGLIQSNSRLAGGWVVRAAPSHRSRKTARVLDLPVTQHCRAVCNSICPHNTHTQHSITSMAPRLACTLRGKKKTSCSYASSQWPVGGRHQAEISEEIGFASRGCCVSFASCIEAPRRWDDVRERKLKLAIPHFVVPLSEAAVVYANVNVCLA
ncbi:hypothetical protein SORBI_3001G293633 [Sorghum bicolor]|uniref:Uncharacterized protein n=1 Tax=Sorghum bicolor TaxID=4558 RepID=A0A1Z5S866_SORBI|nr:hypothetical protein SORBI_3001G293633 [Sorghum bicolor]